MNPNEIALLSSLVNEIDFSSPAKWDESKVNLLLVSFAGFSLIFKLGCSVSYGSERIVKKIWSSD
jgi:hypothetical protein